MRFYYTDIQLNDELILNKDTDIESHFKVTAKENKPLRFKLQTFGQTIYNQVDHWWYRNDFYTDDLTIIRNSQQIGVIPNRFNHKDFRDNVFTNTTQILLSLIMIGSAIDWMLHKNYTQTVLCILALTLLHLAFTIFRRYESMI
jgi:hypothetical protein